MCSSAPFAHISGWLATAAGPHARVCGLPPRFPAPGQVCARRVSPISPATARPRLVRRLQVRPGIKAQSGGANIWRKHARFGGSGTGRERHFVYHFEAHLPRTQAPRWRPPRQRRGRAARHYFRRSIRVEGHQDPAQWARGGEAGEGRVVGQQVGGIWAGRLTEGRSGRVEARSGPGHGLCLRTADLWCPHLITVVRLCWRCGSSRRKNAYEEPGVLCVEEGGVACRQTAYAPTVQLRVDERVVTDGNRRSCNEAASR
jgi:hypothetical protein